ncbi:uncharacterized protein LOC126872634 [Bombus huntii]|uniref:uncharacterized protein LOC126872634 n=1 Tax=Bombus huntii TaxID=85661 RepID=UPI0021AA4B9D|nr:uncharacterized protein LOC126872634 [Bombus huntii]
MASPREELSRAQNSDLNPTSEVGSESLKVIQEQMALMRELIQTLAQKPREQVPSAEPVSLVLPRFNSEAVGADPAAWCATVSVIMEKRPLQDDALYLAITRALEGTAVQWFTQVPVSGLTWTRFTGYFLARYGGTETATSLLMRIFNEQPLKDETTGTFGNRLRSLLSAKWGDPIHAELINAVVFLRLISHDQRVERIALTNDIQTQDQFYKEMRALSYARKRPVPSSNNPPAEPEAKRSRPSVFRIKCYRCGAYGHRRTECHSKIQTRKEQDIQNPKEKRPAASSKVTCFRCHEEGHIASDCPSLRKRSHDSIDERRIDSGVVEAPACRLSHLGESYPFYFDSGAECSLIKEFSASKFSGKRITDIVAMRGIGNTCIKSTLQILSTVCINGLTLEIVFHVLVDDYLKYDIMIGREILSQGFDVNITQDSLVICKTKIINACGKVAEDAVDINEVDTDVIGNDKDRLISVLEKFKESFITGLPRTRVSTGQ